MTTQSCADKESVFEIVVIVACYNRIAKTKKWIESLNSQKRPNWNLNIVAVDDGSTDGTDHYLNSLKFVAKVIRGDGKWYWAKSMEIAEEYALENFSPDYIMWANDDVEYLPGTFEYIDSMIKKNQNVVYVGQFLDPSNNQLSYGGHIRVSSHPMKYKLLPTISEGERADAFNGNLALIPKSIFMKVGKIDGNYSHAFADFDYSIRVIMAGYEIIILNEIIGYCSNSFTELSTIDSFLKRIKFAFGKKGYPLFSRIKYLRKYGGRFWFIYLPGPYIRAIFKIKSRP